MQTSQPIALSIRSVAELLDLHYMTAWKLVKSGDLPARKVGGTWRVTRRDLETYLGVSDGLSDAN
jgi:excisionase family DNA binding protein